MAMNRETFVLDINTSATGAGAERTCKDLIDKTVQIGGVLGGGRKLRLEGTLGPPPVAPGQPPLPETWHTLVANILTPGGIFAVPQGVIKIRLSTDVVGTGVTTAILAGLNIAREP